MKSAIVVETGARCKACGPGSIVAEVMQQKEGKENSEAREDEATCCVGAYYCNNCKITYRSIPFTSQEESEKLVIEKMRKQTPAREKVLT